MNVLNESLCVSCVKKWLIFTSLQTILGHFNDTLDTNFVSGVEKKVIVWHPYTLFVCLEKECKEREKKSYNPHKNYIRIRSMAA